ncbi:hypothetical protein HU200_055540 [Digitaria exilis]|uniref:Uncharacterized protein n=1 Tax=Digitaria exilis TaxID=1010633 RepID=A0A835AI85_9POAL|nr:hypothetical protein HU200_055540 [Digitaria exilis]
MKLLIDIKANRVLFAEADKNVVDFLFSLLALPVATIVQMLGKGSISGSFGNLYGSVENLDHTYVLPHMEKGRILNPTVMASPASTSRSSLLLPMPSSGQPESLFRCASYGWLIDASGYNVQKAPSQGFVQGVVTYTVKDDLTVTPMSTISTITMLNAAGVSNFGDLQEMTVLLGYAEGLAIVKASLQSKTVLTDVFLKRTYY